MKKIHSLLVLTILILSTSLSAQLVVNYNALSTNQLVQDILIGQDTDVSNITFSGNVIQRGYFNGENSSIGINSGVILATGNIFVALGPNDIDNATEPEDSGCGTPQDQTGPGGLCRPGDSDLNSILGANVTFDAAALEFDFIPRSDEIRFNYSFASEEYPEYVCSEYNDLFAFLLSGPNPAGGNYNEVNIARIPGTTLPVAINTINLGVPGEFGTPFGCSGAAGSLAYGYLYNGNEFNTTMQFDGFTEKLEAFANVIPCETYHVKIVIADAEDGVLDSAVFLEENSFSTGILDVDFVLVDTETNMETPGTTIPENCDFIGEITFGLSNPTPVDFNIPFTTSGTAINGMDYAILPDSIFIPAGESEVTLLIEPFEDAITEGIETIIFEVESSACGIELFTITIGEEMLLTPPTIFCATSTAVSTGFQWEPVPDATGYEVSEDGGTTWIMPSPGPLTHNFTGLGQSETVELWVRALGGIACEGNPAGTFFCSSIGCELTATLSSIPVSCNGGSDGSANVTANGGIEPLMYEWDANAGSQTTATATGLSAGVYSVTATDAVGCVVVGTVQINEPSVLSADFNSVNNVSCGGGNNGEATVVPAGGTPDTFGNYTYQWSASAGSQTTPTASNLLAGTHTVTVTDVNGCFNIASVSIGEPSIIDLYIFTSGSTATAVISGGTTPYIYQWNDPNMQVTETAINLESGTYSVTVTDANGCEATAFVDLTVGIETPEYLSNFEILPNPSNGKFIIDLQFEVRQTATIQVFNTLGQEMYHFTDTQSHFLQTIDMQEAAVGTYFVVISTESGRVVRRVVLM